MRLSTLQDGSKAARSKQGTLLQLFSKKQKSKQALASGSQDHGHGGNQSIDHRTSAGSVHDGIPFNHDGNIETQGEPAIRTDFDTDNVRQDDGANILPGVDGIQQRNAASYGSPAFSAAFVEETSDVKDSTRFTWS